MRAMQLIGVVAHIAAELFAVEFEELQPARLVRPLGQAL